jgi:hypothetical protein
MWNLFNNGTHNHMLASMILLIINYEGMMNRRMAGKTGEPRQNICPV